MAFVVFCFVLFLLALLWQHYYAMGLFTPWNSMLYSYGTFLQKVISPELRDVHIGKSKSVTKILNNFNMCFKHEVIVTLLDDTHALNSQKL